MTTARLVLGDGPDALRVAAVLAAQGVAVTLLQRGPGPAGLRHPDLPVGLGLARVDPVHRPLAERVLGPLVEAPEGGRAVLLGGKRHAIPLTPASASRLLPPPVGLAAARNLLRARVRNRIAQLIGGGQEERTYADWVIRRMGGPAWTHLYARYAARRFAYDPRQLSASAARATHGDPGAAAPVLPGGTPRSSIDHAVALITGAGGEIRTGVSVQRLRIAEGRVVAVELATGEALPTDGPLWTTLPGAALAPLFDAALPHTSRADAAFLQAQDRLTVALSGDVRDLPAELHILDEAPSFWRVTRPPGLDSLALFHLTLPAGSPDDPALPARIAAEARAAGIGDFDPAAARVERIPGWQPLWRITAHSRLRLTQLAFQRLGLISAGRGGAFAPLDPGEEIAWAAALSAESDPDQRELHRRLIEPPGKVDDLDASPLRLIGR